jgi:hypothetical protein
MVKVNEIKDSLAADLIGFAFQQICNQGGSNPSAGIPFRRCLAVLLKAATAPRAERSFTRYGMLGAINGYYGRCKFNAGPHVEGAIQKRRAA